MNRERALRVVLVLVGVTFIAGVYSLMNYLWPGGWRWHPHQPQYEQMIVGVYATLGVFLLIASRRPAEHRSLIAFTAWSSLVHAAIMMAQAFASPVEHEHLLGDVPALVIVGIVLLLLAPRPTNSAQSAASREAPASNSCSAPKSASAVQRLANWSIGI
jgi:hypothetical protein